MENQHSCLLTDDVIVRLKALRASYKETECLMSGTENIDAVRTRLQQINSDFDSLMFLCAFVDDNDTMPGSISRKVDIIRGKENFNCRVEKWLANVELPVLQSVDALSEFVRPATVRDSECLIDICGPNDVVSRDDGCSGKLGNEPTTASIVKMGLPESASRMVSVDAHSIRNSTEATGVTVVHDKRVNIVTGSRDNSGSSRASCVSSHSSRASRVKESRVKVHLAKLALRHEEEKQREEEEKQREEEVWRRREEQKKREEATRRRQDEERKRQKAMHEKRRELEMAQAELEAWETESILSVGKAPSVSKCVEPKRNVLEQPSVPKSELPKNDLSTSVFDPCCGQSLVNALHQRSNEQTLSERMMMPVEISPYGFDERLDVRRTANPVGIDRSNIRNLQVPEREASTRGYSTAEETGRYRLFANPPYDGTASLRQSAPETSHAEASERFLPKPSIEQFDGDPLDYWAFVNRFKVHIADRIISGDLKLVYLLQHCSKKVYDRIKHYAGGPDKQQCYRMVWQELYDRYGQPHIIGRCCEQRLLELPKVGPYDGESLENMAILMKRCLASLKEFSESTTMNTVGFISSLVEKLPIELRRKWVSEALKVQMKSGTLAGFADFARFIIRKSVEANSTYYKAVFPARSAKSDSHGSKMKRTPTFATTTSVRTSSPAINQTKNSSFKSTRSKPPSEANVAAPKITLSCYCCGQQHKLNQCDEFRNKSLREKRFVVREKRLCYRCLRSGHGIRDCRSEKACEVESCKSNTHHTLLHVDERTAGNDVTPAHNTVMLSWDSGKGVRDGASLDILPVRVSNGDVEVLTYALLDPGSSMSFCERDLIDELGIKEKGSVVETFMETLTTKRPERLNSVSFSLTVKPLDSNGEMKLTNVVMIDQIPVDPSHRNVMSNLEDFEHLGDVTLPEVRGATVTLLIGNDNYLAQFPIETRIADSVELSGPLAIKTPLGWVLKGSLDSAIGPGLSKVQSFLLNRHRNPTSLDNMEDVLVTEEGDIIPSSNGISCWDVDNLMSWLKSNQEAREFGMKYSAEDVVAYECMQRSISFVEGRFELPLLWKDTSVVLPESLSMARKRLDGVWRRLLRDDNMREMYCKQMESVLSHDYAEKVPEDEWDSVNRVWYIPHHPVVNPNKPGKVRIVYDCAARSHGVSLNDKLMKGPDLVNQLVGVLLRFRKDRIAIFADIESMFYQIRCESKDCDSLRFLWWPEGNLNAEAVPYRMKVHLFGAKSSPSCASFALLETAKRFGKFFPASVADVIKKGFYVDDCLTTVGR